MKNSASNWRAGHGPLRRNDPAVQRIVLAWRRLCSARLDRGPTAIACSGGADSTALLLALASSTRELVVAHIVHDLRPRHEALTDRDAVARLAAALEVPFESLDVSMTGGNWEAAARRARYRALVEIAARHSAPIIVTGHTADDQLETLIMRLSRGCGPRGLGGIAPRRALTPELCLVRPMLEVTRAETERLCTDTGVAWCTDATNASRDRLRSALRAGPIAELLTLQPHAAVRAARTADLCRDAAALLRAHAASVFGESLEWPRDHLRQQRPIILGEGLRRAYRRAAGNAGLDRLGASSLRPAIRAIRDRSTEPRSFDWPSGVTLWVTSQSVRLSR